MEKSLTIAIINGPNLNLVGTREPAVYGTESLDEHLRALAERCGARLTLFQSNHEGDIIDALHRAATEAHAVVLNAGAYSHTSLAIADAVRAIDVPVIEVHISNIFAREEIRRQSLIAPACLGIIAGLGLKSYDLAVDALVRHLNA